ncbi:MAG: hypothetical protein A3K09_03855, partial [Nitrospinae bacterium RIFCSPLOWO2_12_FULL_47_7]
QSDYSEKYKEKFYAFLDKVADDQVLFSQFQSYLKSHAGERVLQEGIEKYFADLMAANKWMSGNGILKMTTVLARNYILCAQLKTEMDLFALTSEEKREHYTNGVIDFQIFGENNEIVVNGLEDKKQVLTIKQDNPSVFDIYVNKGKSAICSIDISTLDTDNTPVKINPIKKPFMGVTFMGVGSGFAAKKKNSCLIAWTEGKGIMVDALPDSNRQTLSCGISDNDIRYIFLTHVHSDHDAGLVEKILHGERIKIISSRMIFDSFLRKIEAITCFPTDVIESFVDFLEVEPYKKIKLPGFQNSYFTFDYSLHSIPTGRFILTYEDKKNKVKKTISHSGDAKFDIKLINQWYEKGIFTKKRRDAVLGFIWDADLIIHDVGGGILHTELESLEHIDSATARKTILVHQHIVPNSHPIFRFAKEGDVEELIKAKKEAMSGARLETLKHIPLFKGFQQNRLLDMFSYSEVVKYQPNEMVFAQNDMGDAFYIILDGFAEVIIDGKSCAIYERGKFFGELAISTQNPYRRA